MRRTNKQSAALDGLIIKAVTDGLTLPRDIFKLLSKNKHAKGLTQGQLYQRVFRLKRDGRVSCPDGKRNPEAMQKFRDDVAAIVNGQSRQLGVRGVFYLAVAAGLCEKTDGAYQGVVHALDILRMSGDVAFDRIIDSGRIVHPHGLGDRSPVVDLVTAGTDYDEIQTFIENKVSEEAEYEPNITDPEPPSYTQGMEPDELTESVMKLDEVGAQIDHGPWDGCEVVPFVVCEKEGLSGIIQPVCLAYDVPYVAVRGGASITVLHQIWELMQEGALPWRVLTLYDFDQAGENIEAAAVARLRAFGGEAKWTSERIAVTPKQVKKLKLPTRPEKKGDGVAVELDAIPPDTLAKIVTAAIKKCIPKDIDDRRLVAEEEAEAEHDERLSDIVEGVTVDYEPQRNEEMQEYVEEYRSKFNDLHYRFKLYAPK